MRLCGSCKKEKKDSDFSFRNKERTKYQWKCRECQNAYFRQYYSGTAGTRHKKLVARRNRKIREEFFKDMETRKGAPCTDCGGKFKPWQMDFDHVRGQKLGNLAQGWSWSKKRLEKELKKCELVCANCHRDRTYQRSHCLVV